MLLSTFLRIYLFYFWLHQVFVAVRGLFLVAVSRACSWLQGAGSGVHGLQPLPRTGSVVVVDELSCPVACGIFPDGGSNLWCLHGCLSTGPPGMSCAGKFDLLAFCWRFYHQCSQGISVCSFVFSQCLCLALVSGSCWFHRMNQEVLLPQFWGEVCKDLFLFKYVLYWVAAQKVLILMKSTLSIFVTVVLLMLSENPFPNWKKKKVVFEYKNTMEGLIIKN